MLIRLVAEYNSQGQLLYAENYTGAFVRGRTRAEALEKLDREMLQYLSWREGNPISSPLVCKVQVVQEEESDIPVWDADTQVLFDRERLPLSGEEYHFLKWLVLKSAADFQKLFDAIPDKEGTVLSPRNTFYGPLPTTATEMYRHTRDVNGYYFGEIQVDGHQDRDNSLSDILDCRQKAFERLEKLPGYLDNPIYEGSFGESWSLRKVCRRFVWHDRIHAKAMYRMAARLCGPDKIADPFFFHLP